MKRLATAQQMKMIDDYTINEIGISSLVLMERAGFGVYEEVIKKAKKDDKILIICGSGNNGADGMVVARYLIDSGYDVEIALTKKNSGSREYCTQLAILKKLDASIMYYENIKDDGYDIVVDALFGTGLNKDVTGDYHDLIKKINAIDAYKISIDIASGLNATYGSIMNIAIKADLTVTFGLEKVAHNIYPGRLYSGKVIVKDIGFLEDTKKKYANTHYTYDDEFNLLPKRIANSHKGTYGKVLIVAGSKDMFGALFFAAKSAYLMGSGLVYIYTNKENKIAINSALPEAICYTYEDNPNSEILYNLLKSTDVCMVGSGLSTSEDAKKILDIVIKSVAKKIVLDADAINILDEKKINRLKGKDVVITPHVKEFQRLINRLSFEDLGNNITNVVEFSKKYDLKLVLKDASTVIAEDENNIFINTTGNTSLSKGGSGDILAGIISSLIGQGVESYEAMRLGCFIHGKIAESVSKIKGERSVLATDLLNGWTLNE